MDYFLLGEKLIHSHSPKIHEKLGNGGYGLRELTKDGFCEFIKARQFAGVNVTIPYKQTVMPLCDFIDRAAAEIGAVNTVVNCDGKLYGCNTDFDGFIFMCNTAHIDFSGRKVLILGSGGTSKTATAAAKKMGAAKITTVSRNGEINYENVYSACGDAEIIVNTTPVGMYPNICENPISLSEFSNLCGVVDVVYNPLRTEFIAEATALGITCVSGLSMLVAQAAFADRYFRGVTHSGSEIMRITGEMKRSLSNIVLIGMPGCGKSTVGKILSAETGRPLYDIDKMIVERVGMSIPQIFEKFGEEYFRDRETEAVRDAASKSGCIVACGGGTVLRKENRSVLRQNGRIIYIKRRTDELAKGGRPLSAGEDAVAKLFETRRGIYEEFADAVAEESATVNESAKKAIAAFNNTDWRMI